MTAKTLIHQWNRLWNFYPTYGGMYNSHLAKDNKHYDDGHRFPTNELETHLALNKCHETWKSMMLNSKNQPAAQIVISYKYIWRENAATDTDIALPLGVLKETFLTNFWNEEFMIKRFGQKKDGKIYWHYSVGNFGWKNLAPLIALTIPRHPLNNLGGIIVASADFTKLWHPYDGGSLVITKGDSHV